MAKNNEKIEVTEKVKKLILKQVWVDGNNKKISLNNCRLDFSKDYIFLGFKGKNKVVLGDIHSRDASGNEIYKVRHGFVEEGENNGRKYYKLWTDGFNYSLRMYVSEEIEEWKRIIKHKKIR